MISLCRLTLKVPMGLTSLLYLILFASPVSVVTSSKMPELHIGTSTFVEISFKVEFNLLGIKFTVRFLLH